MLLLILRLEAPLMRWGLHSQWNDRDTHNVPTKSAIIGLISCAMGLPRGEPKIEELSRRLKMGVRADRKSLPMVDLQIVSQNSNHTINKLNRADYNPRTGDGGLLTQRHYLQDGCFTVVLSAENDQFLYEAAKALQAPIFPVYLGAKSCVPSRPVFEALTNEYSTLEDALTRYSLATRRNKDNKQNRFYCEIEDDQGANIRQDEVKINQMREYGFRRVSIKYIGD